MHLKVYERGDILRKKIKEGQFRGEIAYEAHLDAYSTFIVYEVFSLLNSNRMTISIVIHDKHDYCDLHFVSKGGGNSFLFKFDWGASKGFDKSILKILDLSNIEYDIIKE